MSGAGTGSGGLPCDAKLRDLSPALTGNTIQRAQDQRGVWHIVNEPAPDRQPQAPLAASAGNLVGAGGPCASGDPRAAGPGVGAGDRPAADRPPGPEGGCPARPSRRLAYLHQPPAAFMSDRDSPVDFFGETFPWLKSWIIQSGEWNPVHLRMDHRRGTPTCSSGWVSQVAMGVHAAHAP